MNRGRCTVVGLMLVLIAVGCAGAVEWTGDSAWLGNAGVATLQSPDKLVEIRISGNENISKHSILAVVEGAGIRLGMDVEQTLIDTGRNAIRGMGWFAQVVPSTTITEEGVILTYTVVEYAKVNKIEITGNQSVSTQEILDAISTKAGGVFNRDVLNEDLNRLEELYMKKGFSAVIAQEPRVDKDGVLLIAIKERIVEEVRIEGNTKTKTYVILREMETRPGDVFNVERIGKDLERLANLGYFEPPVSRRIEIGSDLDKVILTIVVADKRTGELTFAMAYSGQTGWLGRVQASDSNLGGRGRGVDILLERGGFENKSSYEVGWQEPWIDKRRTSLGVRVFNKVLYRSSSILTEDGGETRYDERRRGASVTLGRPRGDYDRYAVSLRHETVNSTRVQQNGPVFSITPRYTRDTRDYYADPARGARYSSWVDVAFADIESSGKANFVTFNTDLRRYVTVGKKRTSLDERVKVIAVRFQLGVANGTVPFFEQYFLGGAESIRGYREDRFWGTKQVMLNVEYRHPVSKAMQAVLFADFGDAWGTPYTAEDLMSWNSELSEDEARALALQDSKIKIHSSYGLGIRFQTPIGPIRIDYGVGEDGGRTHFSIGHVF